MAFWPWEPEVELSAEKASAEDLKCRTEDALLREEPEGRNHLLGKRSGAQTWQVLDHGYEALRFIFVSNFHTF